MNGLHRAISPGAPPSPFPDHLVLTPSSRHPTSLPAQSVHAVLDTSVDERVLPFAQTAQAPPRVSIVTVTFGQLVFSRLCLESLLANPCAVPYEVIVVDNGSTDGTADYLDRLTRRDARVRVHLNGDNRGFAAATNTGVSLSRAGALVFLNNDTIPPEGWLERLWSHLADPALGLIGAVTNRAGNEAEIEVPYRTYGELRGFAREHMAAHAGEVFDIRTATMFCVALRRQVWDRIGPLDERFEVGLFEDDDYSMRVRAAGLRVVCAEDVFVHHFGQATIGCLAPAGEYGRIHHANRARWEAKWGVSWTPYRRRDNPAYRELVQRIRRAVCEVVPPGDTVAVISRGDADLLELDGRRAWHFPQTEGGVYAGHYPADGPTCVAELERLRANGLRFLVIPSTSSWWLEHYDDLRRHLETCAARLPAMDCTIFRFGGAVVGPSAGNRT